jgi:hypothetical protein
MFVEFLCRSKCLFLFRDCSGNEEANHSRACIKKCSIDRPVSIFSLDIEFRGPAIRYDPLSASDSKAVEQNIRGHVDSGIVCYAVLGCINWPGDLTYISSLPTSDDGSIILDAEPSVQPSGQLLSYASSRIAVSLQLLSARRSDAYLPSCSGVRQRLQLPSSTRQLFTTSACKVDLQYRFRVRDWQSDRRGQGASTHTRRPYHGNQYDHRTHQRNLCQFSCGILAEPNFTTGPNDVILTRL